MAPIDEITDILKKALIDALKDREGELKDIATEGGKAARSNPLGDIGNIARVAHLIIDLVALTNPEVGIPIEIINQAAGEGGHLGTGFGSGYFLGYMLFQFAAPYLNYITHAINDAAQSEIFDPATAAALVAKRIIATDFGKSEAHGGGIDDPHFSSLVEAAADFPDMATLLLMRDRSLINDAELLTALRRHGYKEEWIPAIKGMSRQLLPPAELALATLRGNLDEGVARAYAKILSITDDDFTVMVQNTGEPPGLEQLLEAYRRGFIDQGRLERGIRQSRVRNEWIDVVERLRFEPMTTSDAVRAVVENYLTDAQGKEIATQNGLNPDHWEFLRESFGRPLSHEQMLTLFHRGQATEEQVRQAMRESDIKNKYIDQAIDLGRRLIPERTIVSAIDHGVLGHDEGVAMLSRLGFDKHDADVLVRLGTAQKASTHKQLSRTDIVALYEDKLMPKAEAIKRLTELGFSHADAEASLELADYKAKASALKVTIRSVEALFKAHHVTAQEARRRLVAAGVASQEAQSLIDQWTHLRESPVRSLSEAQIISLGTHGVIDTAETRRRLVAYGLIKEDAELLLKLHGLVEYTPIPPTPQTPHRVTPPPLPGH